MTVNISVIRWAAEECARQESGEMSVYHMIEGWLYADASRYLERDPTIEHALVLGGIIEPSKNKYYHFRKVNVQIGDQILPWENVTVALNNLFTLGLEALKEEKITLDEWYKEFEEIHPFVDGNGRVGNILYNWIRGSLKHPIHPPNFWR
jgi:hypothetical protein